VLFPRPPSFAAGKEGEEEGKWKVDRWRKGRRGGKRGSEGRRGKKEKRDGMGRGKAGSGLV